MSERAEGAGFRVGPKPQMIQGNSGWFFRDRAGCQAFMPGSHRLLNAQPLRGKIVMCGAIDVRDDSRDPHMNTAFLGHTKHALIRASRPRVSFIPQGTVPTVA